MSWKYKRLKSGVLFHDTHSERVLLIQSCGQKWGPPKGTKETTDETIVDCAIREVLEETGLRVSKDELLASQSVTIDRATYFYVQRSVCDVGPTTTTANDATGWTWIRLPCLQELVKAGKMDITSHCSKLFTRVLSYSIK